MKNFVRPLLLLVLLALLLGTLAACEKERPVPLSLATPMPSSGALGVQTPKPNTGSAGQPAPGSQQPGTPATPAPPTSQSSGPAAVPAQAVGSDKYFLYKVVQGDTLASIARKFSMAPEAILALNQIANPNALSPAQELKIPGEAPAGYAAAGTYTVQAGDTLAAIAARHGVTVDELQKLNNLPNPNLLSRGQVLQIPAGAAAAPAAAPVPTGPTVNYVVKAGDTLFVIATRYGITVAALQQINNLSDDYITVGQTIKVPSSTAGAASPASPAAPAKTHVVQRGDTLNTIAVRYGVTVAALQAANNLANPNQIYPGQVLRIP